MKKNVKNDKVLRAITIGLATMIAASSAPVSVFAAEGEGETPAPEPSGPAAENNSSEQVSENSQQAEADNSAVIEEAKQLSDLVRNEVVPVVGSIDEAVVAVAPIPGILNEDTVTAVEADLNAAADLIDKEATTEDAFGNLGEARDNVSQAIVNANAADDLIDKANASLTEADKGGKTFEERIEDFGTAENTAAKAADETIDQANKANNAATKSEAVEAKEKAREELDTAEEGLFVAVNEYNAAQEAVINAQSELEEAMEKQRLAQEKLEAARADLNKAGMDANAANEKMKAAQAKLQQMQKDEEKLQQNAGKMQAIERQTYAMMAQYFIDTLGINGCVYNKDGTVNFEESAKKLSQEKIDTKANNPGDIMILGRDLLQKILDYKLSNDPNVDWDTVEIGKPEKDGKGRKLTSHREAREGIVFESDNLTVDKDDSSKGKDQVVIKKSRSSRGRNDKNLTPNADTGVDWYLSNQEDSGRTNRIKVTYKDKDGNDHTEYYNYIYKSGEYGDETDVANSPVYVARINETSDGWVVSEDEQVDIDDYGTIKQKLADAKATLDDFNKAKKAVDDAQKKVRDLEEKIKTLSDIASKTGLDESRINDLKDKLKEANEDLSDAKDRKEALEKKVAEAQKAYDGIDLSRFNEGSSGSDTADRDGSDAKKPASGILADLSVGTFAEAPSFTPAIREDIAEAIGGSVGGAAGGTQTVIQGVLGAAAENEAAPGAAAAADGYDLVNYTEEEGESLVKLDDMSVPLANLIDEEGIELNWWWSFIITLFGATGKAMYDNHRKKKEAKVKADR